MKRTGLWAHDDFLKLFAGSTVSSFGTHVGWPAMMFTAVLALDASPLEVGILSASGIVPGLLFGLAAGAWVDRLRRRPLLIAADVGRAALLATIPLAYAFDALAMAQLYVVAACTGALTIVFDVAYQSYLPALVGRDELLEGNSKLAAGHSVSEIGGFGVSGWLVQGLTGPGAILVDAGSFIASGLFIGGIRKEEPAPPPPETRQGLRREIVEGIRAIWHNGVLRALAASESLAEMSFRVFGAVFLIYVSRDLGFEPGILGVVFAVGGVTSLIGALYATRAASRFGMGRSVAIGRILMASFMFLVPLAGGDSTMALAFLVAQQLGDGFWTITEVNGVSLRQSTAPENVLGRVNAGMRVSGQAAMLLGALLGGVLGEAIGLRGTLVIACCGTMAAGLLLVISPVWGVRRAPLLETARMTADG
jgi:MFS family permease